MSTVKSMIVATPLVIPGRKPNEKFVWWLTNVLATNECKEWIDSFAWRLTTRLSKYHETGGLSAAIGQSMSLKVLFQFTSIPDPDTFIPEGSEGGLVEEFTPAFSQHVQALSQPDFLRMISSMFEALLRFLRILQSQQTLMLDILREEA